ncbi:UNVERIFIED_CONTAM: hypothetical protein NCL1_42965 [Trichonephila clavipes]
MIYVKGFNILQFMNTEVAIKLLCVEEYLFLMESQILFDIDQLTQLQLKFLLDQWKEKNSYICCLKCRSIAWLIVVAAVWGFSTPLIRHGSAGIENITCSNPLSQWLAELRFLATNWKVIFMFSTI